MKYLERRNAQRGFKDTKVMGKIAWDDKYEGQIPILLIDGQNPAGRHDVVLQPDVAGRLLASMVGVYYSSDSFKSPRTY